MKKLLSVLGIILMVISGLFIVSVLLTLPSLLRENKPILSLLASLLYLALFCFLFYLGYRLHAWSRKHAAPPGSQSWPEERANAAPSLQQAPQKGLAQTTSPRRSIPNPSARTAQLPRQSTRKAQPQHKAARISPPAPNQMDSREKSPSSGQPGSGDELHSAVILYEHPDANRETMQTGRPCVERIHAAFRESTPLICRRTVEYIEIGDGKAWPEPKDESFDLPASLTGTVTAAGLWDWIQSLPGPWPVDSKKSSFLHEAGPWCYMVRERAALHLPDCVYSVLVPFKQLESIGPDGLSDESGIGMWLRMKKNAAVGEVIHALSEMKLKLPAVVLTAMNRRYVLDHTELTSDDLLRCEKNNIWICGLPEGSRLQNLLTLEEYRLRTSEWPGSADDAATYGSWWLEKLPMPSDTRLDAVTWKIVADCRLLGLDDQHIQHLFKDGLNRAPDNMICQLVYEDSQAEYAVVYHERGSSTAVLCDSDETEFRFKFLREFVAHCGSLSARNRDAAEAFLLKTRDVFGHTNAWSGMVKEYCRLFPDSAVLPNLYTAAK